MRDFLKLLYLTDKVDGLVTTQRLAKDYYHYQSTKNEEIPDAKLFTAAKDSHGGFTLLYDAVDNGFFFRLAANWSNQTPLKLRAVWNGLACSRTRALLSLLMTVPLYYADLAKDVILCARHHKWNV